MTNSHWAPRVGMSSSALGRILRTRWYWIIGLGLLGVAVALYAYTKITPSYRASATVAINPITSEIFASGSLNQQVNTATEAAIMASNKVRRRAATRLDDGTDASELGDALTVSNPALSLTLLATVRADDPEQAARRANAVAEAYLAERLQVADDQVDSASEAIATRIEELESLFSGKKKDAVADTSIEAELIALRRDQSKAQTLVVNPGLVINDAVAPPSPYWPRLAPMLALGLVGGLLLGVGVALASRDRRRTVMTLDELQSLVPGRVISVDEVLEVDYSLLAGDEDQLRRNAAEGLVAVAAEVRQLAPSGPIVVIGDEQLNAVGAGLCEAIEKVDTSRGADGGARNVLSSDLGTSAVACSSASAVVICAARDLSTKPALAAAIAHPVRATPKETPLAALLLVDGGPGASAER